MPVFLVVARYQTLPPFRGTLCFELFGAHSTATDPSVLSHQGENFLMCSMFQASVRTLPLGFRMLGIVPYCELWVGKYGL